MGDPRLYQDIRNKWSAARRLSAGRNADDKLASVLTTLPGDTPRLRAAYARDLADAAVYAAAQEQDAIDRAEAIKFRAQTWGAKTADMAEAVVAHADPLWLPGRRGVVLGVSDGLIDIHWSEREATGYRTLSGWSRDGRSRIDPLQTLINWRAYCERRKKETP